MRVTQGTFSFLPDLTDAQIRAQIEYCLSQGWAVSVEHTDDPHPRNVYWEMHGNPMFDLKDAAGVMAEVDACRQQLPERLREGERVRLHATAGNRCGCRSSSTGRRRSRASRWTGRNRGAAWFATPPGSRHRANSKGRPA